MGLLAVGILTAGFAAPASVSAQAALSADALRNTSFPSSYTVSGEAPLRDGRFDQRAALNDPTKPAVVTYVDGKMSGDSAAVVLATNTGGSGVFLELHL